MLSRIARLAAFIGHARARLLLVACGLLIGLTVAAGAVLLLLDLRRHNIADTERELKNLSLILAEETDRSFQAAELVQLGLIEHMRELGIDSPEEFEARMGSIEAHQNLKDRIAGLPNIDAIALIDLHGRILNISRFWPAGSIDVTDRDFFKALNGDASLTSVISEPILNRANSTWTLLFVRKFTTPDGRLLGFVSCGIQLAYFEALFSRISLNDGSTFALYRRDGMLLARYPHVDPKIGRTFGDPANFDRVASVATSLDGLVRLTSVMDGKDRLVAPHSLTHYPLIMAVSDTIDAVLGPWRAEVGVFGGGAVLLELVVAGIIVLGVRHLRGYERLAAANAARLEAEAARALAVSELRRAHEREEAARKLRTQWIRFDTALSNMLQGLVMFDDAGRLLVANRCYAELFGLPADELVEGTPYAELMERLVTVGNIGHGDMIEMRERRDHMVAARSGEAFTWELEDGRVFMVTHQPMEAGWLATYEDITERRKAEARISYLAHHDALTNLPNRALFREKLEQAIVHARRGQGLALLCLDLDQFKAVNDTFGETVGDALLQAVAERLLERMRETDTVARLGGDEFAVVQAPIDKPTDATGLARRLIELFDVPFDVAGHQIVIGTSIGIAFAPQDGLDPDQLLKSADLALYRAKVDGRGIYRLFHAEMDAQMQARRLLELDLREALKVGQLELFYQPIVDLQASAVTGFEALLRWRHPERGIIPPSMFIPLAEEIGLIVPIGEWVLREACTACASWPGEMRVAANLSPAQFKSRNLVSAVAQALREAGLAPDRLELEITETVILQDTDATLATLHQFQALGARIAMDDFGTGYSSLTFLRRFPFDRIKIDQSFVRDMCDKQDCGAIVRAVAGLSNELGMATTAEGVETLEQLDAVTLAGCTEVQGYLFSPAVPGCAVPDLLRTIADMLASHGTRAMPEPVG